jgi:hypothetical protein
MGERASIAYVEKFLDDEVRVFFYNRWLADGSIDVVLEALLDTSRTEFAPRLAKAMDEATTGDYSITPYLIVGNYPTLYVRQFGGTVEVALSDSDSAVHSDDLLWVEAKDFISFAERSSGLEYSDRFKFVNALIMDY